MAPTRNVPATMVAAAAAVALLAVLAAARDHDACQTAQQAFGECVPYVIGQVPVVTPNCCTGLRDLRTMGDTAAQRSAICGCIMSEVKAAGGKLVAGRAAGLAGSCKVPIGFVPTKPDFDCSRVL